MKILIKLVFCRVNAIYKKEISNSIKILTKLAFCRANMIYKKEISKVTVKKIFFESKHDLDK
jgi:hypothetical protein